MLGNLAAQGFKDLQFGGIRQATGSHLGVFKVAAGAGIGAVEQLLVGPLEVQQQAQGFPYPHILEHRTTQVEDEALHAGGQAVGDFFTDQATFAYRWGVVGRCPVFGAAFQPIIELPCLECLQGDGVVSVVIDRHLVEVVEAAVDRQVLAPVVLVAHVAN